MEELDLCLFEEFLLILLASVRILALIISAAVVFDSFTSQKE